MRPKWRYRNYKKYPKLKAMFDSRIDYFLKNADTKISTIIKEYKEDYPKNDLDEYLEDKFNYDYYNRNSNIDDAPEVWIDLFNKSYLLFDDIRVKMHKPIQAIDHVKQWYKGKDLPDKINILSFVIDLMENYNLYESQQSEWMIRVRDGLMNFYNNLHPNNSSDDEAMQIKSDVNTESKNKETMQKEKQIPESTEQLANTRKYRIAEGKKTDVAKIISAMYDCRLFKTEDGYVASNKQDLFDVLGQVFNTDFSFYSTLLSRAKQTSNYCDIFDRLKEKGKEYENL